MDCITNCTTGGRGAGGRVLLVVSHRALFPCLVRWRAGYAVMPPPQNGYMRAARKIFAFAIFAASCQDKCMEGKVRGLCQTNCRKEYRPGLPIVSFPLPRYEPKDSTFPARCVFDVRAKVCASMQFIVRPLNVIANRRRRQRESLHRSHARRCREYILTARG